MILISCFSVSLHAFEDYEARKAILDLRQRVKEIESKLNSDDKSIKVLIKELSTRLDLMESENKKLKSENEKLRSNFNNGRLARDSSEYQELRDEINSINRLLSQIMSK